MFFIINAVQGYIPHENNIKDNLEGRKKIILCSHDPKYGESFHLNT